MLSIDLGAIKSLFQQEILQDERHSELSINHRQLHARTPTTNPIIHQMSSPINIPARGEATSPPIDPTKLNHNPAPIPLGADLKDNAQPVEPPLRSPETETPYLDNGIISEPASHPTVAETGVLAGPGSPGQQGGPKKGQLKKVEGGEKKDGIISLGSFGGEGLMAKPSRSPSISAQGAGEGETESEGGILGKQ